MKKLYASFFLLLVIVIRASGQGTDNPILPRIYEDGYTIEQIKNFAMQNTPYSKDYRIKLLDIINTGLRKSGEFINVNGGQPLDESNITWIYEHVYRNQNVHLPKGYKNSWKNGNTVSPCNGKKDYDGPVDQFIFLRCVINLDKPSCANLLGDMEYQIRLPEVNIQQKATPNDGWNYEETQKSSRSMLFDDQPIKPSYYIPTITTDTKKVVDWIKVAKIGGISVGIVGLGTAAYFIFRPHNKPGSPGGAPITRDRIVPVDPGSPGGAPITH